MSDLFTEVDEALKQERLEKLWQQYGGFFIGFIAMIILGTASVEGYKSWNTSQNIRQTNLYIDATSKDGISADELLTVSQDVKPKLKPFVELHAAGLALEKNDLDTALTIYTSIESNAGFDKKSKFIAQYMITNINTDLTLDEKRARYDTLIAAMDNPWRFNAMISAALLEANNAKDYTKARAYLNGILSDRLSPDTLQKKAKSLDILYAAKSHIAQ